MSVYKGLKYYKYGTTLNGTTVGDPTISGTVVSGFSTSKYITSSKELFKNINSFEIYVKFTTGSSHNNYMKILTNNTYENTLGFCIQVSKSDDTIALVFYDGDESQSSKYFGYQAKSGFEDNTTYYCKWIYDGSKIYGYYSTNGQNYTLYGSTNSDARLVNVLNNDTSNSFYIGCKPSSSSSVFTGSIDLKSCYIKVNNNMIWTGTISEESTSSDYDFVELQKINEVYRGFKYYKYQSWTQPALSSNTTTVTEGNIVVSASSNYSGEDPWRALDGNNSGTSFAFNSVPTGWWQVKFPYKLRITGLTFCQRENASSYRTNTARFYTSSDKSTPIGNEFNPPATSYAQTVVSGIPSTGIITDTIYLDVTAGTSSGGMSELIITAQKIVAGTSSSYDYTEPQKIREIYKGSELVYSSISGPRFQLYGYSGNASDHFGVSKTFLIGGMTLGNPYCNNFIHSTNGEYSFWAAIKNITGTLGESGSTITYKAENFPNDVTFNYYNTYQVNGITLYFYLNSSSTYEGSWVMEGSTIGSICLDVKLANSSRFGYPMAASESSCTTYVYESQYTFTRDSSLDCIWSLEGIR